MPENIIQIDQNLLETRLDRLVAEKVAELLNAMPDASGRRDRQRRQVRAHRGAEGVQGRPLRPEPDRQGRQARVEGAQTQGRGLRVRGHRTIPETRGECRGGPHRHVPGRREHPAGGRHQPIAVGRQDAVPDPERQAQEGVRGDRGVAHEAVGGRVPVRVHGRRVAQAFMGRARGERQCPGRVGISDL